jgi:hypothetical protein
MGICLREQGGSIIELMHRITAFVIILVGAIGPSLLFAGGEEPSQQPSAQERLNQVLGSEGGTTVYKDRKGSVESTITLPGGEQIITVQPPQGAGINLGPPLQLHNQTLRFPPQLPNPALPPPPDFPQRARQP